MAICFSKIVTEMKASELTPILALTARPDIISSGRGNISFTRTKGNCTSGHGRKWERSIAIRPGSGR